MQNFCAQSSKTFEYVIYALGINKLARLTLINIVHLNPIFACKEVLTYVIQ